MWYKSDEDPFNKVGHARLIVVRHNAEYNWQGKLDNCTHIVHTETFALGFACSEKSKTKYESNPPSLNWLNEEIDSSCNNKINHLFKALPNGIYELIGEVYNWNSRSYEGEWDGDSEIRDVKIREISFNHAMYFGKEGEGLCEELIRLVPNKNEYDIPYHSETDIHAYMTKQQILINQANTLTRIISDSYRVTDYGGLTIENLENIIHMLMVQIDSEKQSSYPLALEIDEKVLRCLKQHSSLMEEEI